MHNVPGAGAAEEVGDIAALVTANQFDINRGISGSAAPHDFAFEITDLDEIAHLKIPLHLANARRENASGALAQRAHRTVV